MSTPNVHLFFSGARSRPRGEAHNVAKQRKNLEPLNRAYGIRKNHRRLHGMTWHRCLAVCDDEQTKSFGAGSTRMAAKLGS